MNAQRPVCWEVTDLPYGRTIGHIEDPKTGISVGEIGMGTDHVDAAHLACGIMMTHHR